MKELGSHLLIHGLLPLWHGRSCGSQHDISACSAMNRGACWSVAHTGKVGQRNSMMGVTLV